MLSFGIMHALRDNTIFVSSKFIKHIKNCEKLGKGLLNYDFSSEARKIPFTSLKTPQNCLFFLPTTFLDNHGQTSWDTFAFLRRFPIHTSPTPPLTPQTMLDACIQNFFRVSTLYRVGGGRPGRTGRNFRKGCTVLRGNREMTDKYEYSYDTQPYSLIVKHIWLV